MLHFLMFCINEQTVNKCFSFSRLFSSELKPLWDPQRPIHPRPQTPPSRRRAPGPKWHEAESIPILKQKEREKMNDFTVSFAWHWLVKSLRGGASAKISRPPYDRVARLQGQARHKVSSLASWAVNGALSSPAISSTCIRRMTPCKNGASIYITAFRALTHTHTHTQTSYIADVHKTHTYTCEWARFHMCLIAKHASMLSPVPRLPRGAQCHNGLLLRARVTSAPNTNRDTPIGSPSGPGVATLVGTLPP